MTNEITAIAALEQAIEEHSGIALYFYSDKCQPCIALRPKISRLVAEHFRKMNLLFVDAEKNPEIPAHYGVFANPGLLFFFDGREFKRYSKYISISQIHNDIERVYRLACE